MFTLEEMRRAHEVVLGALKPTPAIPWPLLAGRLGADVVVKHENHLPTGAFKVRGGLTYVDALAAARAGDARPHFGDPRQSRPEPRFRREARWP